MRAFSQRQSKRGNGWQGQSTFYFLDKGGQGPPPGAGLVGVRYPADSTTIHDLAPVCLVTEQRPICLGVAHMAAPANQSVSYEKSISYCMPKRQQHSSLCCSVLAGTKLILRQARVQDLFQRGEIQFCRIFFLLPYQAFYNSTLGNILRNKQQ